MKFQRGLDVVGQVAEGVAEHGLDLGLVPARQRPDVDLEPDPVGDDVDLGPRLHDGGGHGGVGAGVGLAGQAEGGKLVAERADGFGVEQRAGDFRREADALDEAAPGVVDVGRRLGARPDGGRPRPPSPGRCRCAVVARRGPGVPRTVMVHQKTPFSPVMTGRRTPSGPAMGKPPASVMR